MTDDGFMPDRSGRRGVAADKFKAAAAVAAKVHAFPPIPPRERAHPLSFSPTPKGGAWGTAADKSKAAPAAAKVPSPSSQPSRSRPATK